MISRSMGEIAQVDLGSAWALPPMTFDDTGAHPHMSWLDAAADAWRPELETLFDRLELTDGSTVLDAGCGSGRITGWLSRRVAPGGRVTGLDADRTMLDSAAQALVSFGREGCQIELWHGHVEQQPFPDATFDAAWCSSVLGYVPDPALALSELTRVVRPGGRVVIVSGDAERATFLPIDPALERRLRAAESEANLRGAWGSPIDINIGRRLYTLASALPVASVEPVTVTWERTSPLSPGDRTFLAGTLTWIADPASREWLGADWSAAQAVFDPASPGYVLDRPALHVLQTACAVVITV